VDVIWDTKKKQEMTLPDALATLVQAYRSATRGQRVQGSKSRAGGGGGGGGEGSEEGSGGASAAGSAEA
jgi:hypothetical protein